MFKCTYSGLCSILLTFIKLFLSKGVDTCLNGTTIGGIEVIWSFDKSDSR